LSETPALIAFGLLVASGSFGALSSILLRTTPISLSMSGLSVSTAVNIFGAITSYGIGFVLYAFALQRLPLTIAYPVMVATTVLEVYAYSAVAGESITTGSLVGAALIMVGTYFVVR
jgi:small multidrug resistance pump